MFFRSAHLGNPKQRQERMQGSFRDLAINTKGDAVQQRRANGWTEPNGRSTSPPVNNYSTFFGADAVSEHEAERMASRSLYLIYAGCAVSRACSR